MDGKTLKILLFIFIPILVIAMAVAAVVVILVVRMKTTEPQVQVGELESLSFSPGYSDMDGGYHCVTLEKNDEGVWVIVHEDRDEVGGPTTLTTYAVDPKDAENFQTWVKDSNILTMETRRDKEDFALDYSPWRYTFVYDDTTVGGSSHEFHSFGQYQFYSDKDYDRIEELHQQLEALEGEELSRTTEEE